MKRIGDKKNRVQTTVSITNYQYDANSNRLDQVGSQAPQTFDAAGHTLTARDNKHAYTWNQAGRLAEFRKDGVLRGQYTYNALGQRSIGKLYNTSGVQTATGENRGQTTVTITNYQGQTRIFLHRLRLQSHKERECVLRLWC